MKKVFLLGLLAAVIMSSCVKSYDSIKPEEYGSYCKVLTGSTSTTSSVFDYSPQAYTMIKGENPFAGYSIKIVNISTPLGAYSMYGDPTKILNTQYPDADLILGYRGYFFVCYKIKK